MIIGYDGSRAFESNRTGTENYSYQLLLHLSKIDNRNSYIVYIRPGIKLSEKWPGNFTFKRVNWPRLWTQLGLASKTFQDPLDVLFVPAHTLPIIRKPDLKTVITVHDLGSEYLPKMHQIKQRFYLSYMQKHQLKGATKIIAVSKATKEDLITKIGIDAKKIQVTYEGYSKELFKGAKTDALISSLMPYFLFVGTVQPRKNLERLIKAFKKYDGDENLVIAGQRGWLADEIYKLPKQLGIEKKIKFLGYLSDEKLPALYSGATALTFPSLFEGFGLPILEAQACGCPVLTSKTSSMPEVGGNGAIYVDPYSVDDIVVGLKKMEDRRLKMELVKKGFENIKRFSWEKCARETLKVFEEL